jgi:hypothetical protein
MSAPIGRVRIKTSEGGKRRTSGSGRWRAAEAPREAEMPEAEDGLPESTHPPFYPYPLNVRHDDD